MKHEVGALARVVCVHGGPALLGRVQHHLVRRLVLLVGMLLLVSMLMLLLVSMLMLVRQSMRVGVHVRRRLMLKMLRLRLR
jgi:hypothetical protein